MSVIHDIRNKLYGIIMNSTIIASDEAIPEETRIAATSIMTAAQETLKLCESMTELVLEQRVSSLEEQFRRLQEKLGGGGQP